MIDEKKLIKDLKEYKIDNISINGKSIIDIINKQPKEGWIPCEVEMPKEHDSMFAKLKGTDKWNSSMFEKVSDVVNVTIEDQNGKGVTVHACTTDGKWSCDLLRVNKSYRVTAWQPLPAPYKKEGAE